MNLLAGTLTRLLASSYCLLTLCSPASVTAPRYGCPLQYLPLHSTLVHFLDVSRKKGEISFLQSQPPSFNSSSFCQGMPLLPLPPRYLLQAGRKGTLCMYLGIRKNIFLPLRFFFFCFQHNDQFVGDLLGLDKLQD